MRFLGADFGQRRVGLAVSDATGTLARPWRTMTAGATPEASAGVLVDLIAAEGHEALSDLGGIVVGLPRRLNGEDTSQSAPAREFARVLGARTGLPVYLQDERLSSYEAETRLAEREPDWRLRKAKLDAAAAAVILQDYLDGRPPAAGPGPSADFPESC
jgi:putative holliday junction resolvase